MIVRINQASLLLKNIENKWNLRIKYGALLDLFKLICIILFVSHILACSWYFIGIQEA